jgi:hypothetical protein
MKVDPTTYKALAAWVRDEFPDDDQLLADTLEGETDFAEAIGAVLAEIDEAETFAAALKEMAKRYTERRAAQEAKAEKLRGLLSSLMTAADLRKFKHARGTVSIRPTPQRVTYDGDPAALPDDLRTVTIKPDLRALKDALANGVVIPGAALTNGGETVSIRRA